MYYIVAQMLDIWHEDELPGINANRFVKTELQFPTTPPIQ
jgi:hypothetical protein